MHESEYTKYDTLGLAELVAKKEVSAEELLSCAEQRYHNQNPTVNAVVTPMWSQAKNAIREGLPKGLFHGVPMPLKDLGQNYQGVVTSNGSRLFADNIADHDSTPVSYTHLTLPTILLV